MYLNQCISYLCKQFLAWEIIFQEDSQGLESVMISILSTLHNNPEWKLIKQRLSTILSRANYLFLKCIVAYSGLASVQDRLYLTGNDLKGSGTSWPSKILNPVVESYALFISLSVFLSMSRKKAQWHFIINKFLLFEETRTGFSDWGLCRAVELE